MNFSQISYNYLSVCKIKVSKEYFEKRIKSHPDYPALLSFTDTLDELGLEYKAVQAEEKHIPQFSFPFLAQTPKAVNGFEIVPSLEYFENNRERFLNSWVGIAVMVSASQRTNNNKHDEFVKSENESALNLKITIGIGLFIFLLINIFDFNTALFTFSLLCISGITITGFIILHKFGKSNAITQQLCSTVKSHSCDLVLNSKASEIIKGVHFGDAGLIYFSGLLLFSLFSIFGKDVNDALTLLIIPCSLALLFSFFSLYYQWKVVKAWCRMCLITIAIVWLQAIIPFLQLSQVKHFTPNILFLVLLQFILAFSVAACWLLIKPLIKSKLEEKGNEIKLLKWKRNPGIFQSLLQNQPSTNTFLQNNPMRIGNPDAPLQFAIVSNPFCRPCAKAHYQLEKLYKKYPHLVSISVIFFVKAANDLEDRRTIAVECIINTHAINDNCLSVLHDWFDTMDLKKWKERYPFIKEDRITSGILQGYQEWIEQNNVAHTPYVYLNGHQIPKQYNLDDMDSFIFELSDRLRKQVTEEQEKLEAIV